MVPRRPYKNTGFRPILSERRLHWKTLTACAAKYKDTYRLRRDVAAERRRGETYYESCVLSDLSFVTTNDRELTNELSWGGRY
jgi:hypothetical protein